MEHRVFISQHSIPSPEVTKEVTEATRVCQYILPFKVYEELLNDRLRYHLAPCQNAASPLSGWYERRSEGRRPPGRQQQKCLRVHYRAVRLFGLSEKEQYIMQCMCMVPISGIDVYVLQECLALEDMDDIYQLTAKSWLMQDEETYKIKMHPVICDVAKQHLQPDPEKFSQYILCIWKHVENAWF